MAKLQGRYRITEMEMWDKDFIDEEMPGFIEFKAKGVGQFHFGYVRCDIDWRSDEEDRAEFSFQGFDEMEPTSGRGWAELDGDSMTGELMFFHGDDSGFTAKKT